MSNCAWGSGGGVLRLGLSLIAVGLGYLVGFVRELMVVMSDVRGGGPRLRRAATVASVLALAGAGFVAAPAQGADAIAPPAAVSARPALPVDSSAPVTSTSPSAAVPTPAPVTGRGDIVYRRGVPVRDVSVSGNGAVVSATVFWNQQMIARKGNRDRFNVRLAAFGSAGAASLIVLKNRSTTKRPPAVQKITLKLSKAKAKQLRASSDVVLAVSQQYGRAGTHRNKYFRQYVTVKKLNARSTARSSARSPAAPTARAGRDCSTIEIKPGADLSNCDLSRANLSVCDLSGVNLSGAILSGAVLTACNLNNAELAGADLSGVVSGGITGTPASLPDGWALVNGVLTTTGPRPPPETFAVTYAGGGADSGTVPVDGSSPYAAGATVTVAGNTGSLVKAGNTFGGWNDGTTTYAPAATFTMPASTVTLTAVWTATASCATGGGAAGTCVVGNTGPGGGKVFYVNESNPTGSRYMEAVVAGMTPAWDDTNGGSYYQWCAGTGQTNNVSTGTAIGSGKTNTDNMVAACTSGSANSVRAYTGGGLPAGSWSLPSLDELNALDVSGVGGLATFNYYWSSSQRVAFSAWFQLVGLGGGSGVQSTGNKNLTFHVRPVRAF